MADHVMLMATPMLGATVTWK